MKYIIIFFIIAFVIPCVASEWDEGENLIVKGDLETDNWDIKRKESEHLTTTIWISKEQRNKDIFVITVFKSPEGKVEEFRKYKEAPSKKQCSKVKYEDLDYVHNKLPAIFWYTDCTLKNDNILKMVHLAIKGNYSFYHLRKIWKYDVTESEVNEWKNRIGKAYVCDTRSEDNMCPEGFTEEE